MEDQKLQEILPKPIISKEHLKHSSTYTSGSITSLGKIKRKRVVFIDRVQNLPLYTVYNYEPVELFEEDLSPKSSSCACIVF